jgi:beta-lactamase regulating signal transducer with metallopeptidase domain
VLSYLFYWVLNISIIGSVSGLIVLLLRTIKKLPRSMVYLLWLIPFVRFLIPFGVAYQYSLLNLLSRFTTKTVTVWQSVPKLTMTNSVQAASSYFPIEYKTNLLESIFLIASIVWLIIAAAAILTAILLYHFTKSELKSAELIKDNIYKSDKITATAVYGIFHPKIIIPAAFADRNLDYIVKHEQVHIKRKDNLFRVVAVVTACIHWFNPLVWILLKNFFVDMELACDAKVIKTLNENQIKDYASAILAYTSGKMFFASAFGGAKTKVRIENILSYKKLTLLSSFCLVTLISAIAIVLITNAVS